MIKIFGKIGKEGQERRRRIRESKDVIVCVRSLTTEFFEGRLVDNEDFNASDYKDALCTNFYGNQWLVLYDCPLSKKVFFKYFYDKDVFISKVYKDLDGKESQTPFSLY